jgi:hypothetical protein
MFGTWTWDLQFEIEPMTFRFNDSDYGVICRDTVFVVLTKSQPYERSLEGKTYTSGVL